MFVLIARFEGGTAAQIEEEGARIRRDLEALSRSTSWPPAPGEGIHDVPVALAGLASRFEMLVDRERGAVALLFYAETADQARGIREFMDRLWPSSAGWGTRVSAEPYEVYLDRADEGDAVRLSRLADEVAQFLSDLEEGMESFWDRDGQGQHEAVKKWCEENDRGFVLNCKSTTDFWLHRADCPHFTFDPSTPVSLTRNRKVCSLDRTQLERWARERGILTFCSDCM